MTIYLDPVEEFLNHLNIIKDVNRELTQHIQAQNKIMPIRKTDLLSVANYNNITLTDVGSKVHGPGEIKMGLNSAPLTQHCPRKERLDKQPI